MDTSQATCVTARREIEARRAPALAALRAFAQPRVTLVPTPAWATPKRTFGAKARGLAYERKVKKVLTKICTSSNWQLLDHPWFLYTCGQEAKYFQPDFLIQRPDTDWILAEVKLTYVDTTWQLSKYLHYLKIFGVSCTPITIVRNLTEDAKNIIDDFSKVTSNSVLHLWL